MTLTLCLIARDEEALLPGCLASVRGVVDEVVVCDTGSSDRTPEIAEQAGATLVRHPWDEDFAAARNAALSAATGDWILVLDADERLAPGAGETLRRALVGALDCGMLPLHNASALDADPAAVLSGEARLGEPVLLPRLLRRTGDLRWEGRVHESVAAWIRATGARVTRIDAPIVHLGSVPELRAALDKDERNRRLLARAVEERPDDPVLRTYFARELIRAGDPTAASEAAAAFAALQRAWERGERPAPVATVSLHAFVLLQAQRFSEAEAALREVLARGADHPNVHQLLGVAIERQDDPARLAEARAALTRALEAHGRTFSEELSPGATSWASRTWLGVVELRAGEPEAALAHFEEVLATHPAESARFGRVEALLELGRPEEALADLEPLLGTRADGWVLAASAMESLGRYEELPLLLGRARATSGEGFVSGHRRVLLEELDFRAGLYQGRVTSGPGRWATVAALLGRAPHHGAVTPIEEELRGLAFHLLRAGRSELLEPIFEPRAEELVPGFEATVRALLDELGLPLEDDGEPAPIFVGGAGRSGTTLFRAMLDAHHGIACGPEAKLVPAICSLREQWLQAMGPDLAEAGVSESVLDGAVRGFVAALLERLAPDGARIAEKTPHNVLHVALLGRLFPRARFVHLVRDGRAVAASLVRQRWIQPGTNEPVWYCADLESAARYWASVVATARQQAASVPGRYLEIRYEDLVEDPEGTMRRVLAFLGERWDPAVLAHHRAGTVLPERESSSAAVAEAVHTGAIDRWRREVPADDLARLEAAHGDLLRALGYDTELHGSAVAK